MDEVQTYAEGGDNHIIDTMVPWRKAEEDRMERFQIWLGSKQGKALINKMLLDCCKPKLVYADYPQHSVAPTNLTSSSAGDLVSESRV